MCILERKKPPMCCSLKKKRQIEFSEKCSINLQYTVMLIMGASFVLLGYKLCLTPSAQFSVLQG